MYGVDEPLSIILPIIAALIARLHSHTNGVCQIPEIHRIPERLCKKSKTSPAALPIWHGCRRASVLRALRRLDLIGRAISGAVKTPIRVPVVVPSRGKWDYRRKTVGAGTKASVSARHFVHLVFLLSFLFFFLLFGLCVAGSSENLTGSSWRVSACMIRAEIYECQNDPSEGIKGVIGVT